MSDYEIEYPEDPEEIVDYYVEQSFALRELEILMWHNIGEVLSNVQNLESYAKEMKRPITELKAAIEFYKKYPKVNSIPLNKASSWRKIKKEFMPLEKSQKKGLKKILSERLEKNKTEFERTGDLYIKGRLDEDKELLEG